MKIKKFIPNKSNYHLFLLVGILIAAAILRFYNFPNRYGFDFDASRDALTATLMVQSLKIPLLGSLSSATSLSSGPWYYYFLAPFEALFPLYGSWIMIGIFNLIFIVLMYKLGESIEDKVFGLILALLTAFSTSQIILSNTLSNPSPIPVFATLALIFFVHAIKKRNPISVFFVGFFVALGINIHYEMMAFLIFPLLILIFMKNKIKNFVLLTVGFFIPFIPMVIYDLKNNWINLKGAFIFLTASNSQYYIPNRWLFYVRDFWPKLWANTLGVPIILSLLIIFSFILLTTYLVYKRKIKKEFLLILVAFVVDFILLRYFPQDKRIYYLYYLYPYILLFTGFIIYFFYKTKKLMPFSIGFLVILLVFMLSGDVARFNSDQNHILLTNYKKNLLIKYPSSNITIYSCNGDIDKGMGLAYLLTRINKSSSNGIKIGLTGGDCLLNGKFMKINNTMLFVLSGSEPNLENQGWYNVSSKSMEEIKSKQLYRSY